MRDFRNSTQQTSGRVALGGIISALCLTLMFLCGVFPALYIAAPMCAGMLMIILAEEVSSGWAWLTYLSVSLLALVVTFDKEAALMFILFFGYYPILRPKLEHIPLKLLRLVVKLAIYESFLCADYFLTVYVLGVPTFDDEGKIGLAVLAGFATLVFLMYDALLSRMGWAYRRYFVRLLHRRF